MRRNCLAVLMIVGASSLSAQGSRLPQFPANWTLTEELRLEDDDAEKSFGEIRGIMASRNGNIFVLDYKAQEIRVFDSGGKFLRLAARRGNGPGEITDANGLIVGPDDVVWTNDPRQGRWSAYSAAGEFVRQLIVPIRSFGYIWGAAADATGRILDPIFILDPSKIDPATNRPTSVARIRRVRLDTGAADTVDHPVCVTPPPPTTTTIHFRGANGGNRYMGVPFLPRAQTVLTRQGTIWCTPSAEYRLSIHTLGTQGASPFREVVRHDLAAPPVSAAERKAAEVRIDSTVRTYGPIVTGGASLIPKNKPVIASIVADDQGRVWVRRTDTPAEHPEFEVFDPSGRPVARVRAGGKVGSLQVFITGNLLYTVVRDEFDVESVVRYRINR